MFSCGKICAAGICFFVFLEFPETADQTKGGQMKKLSTEGCLFFPELTETVEFENTGLWDISLGEVFLLQR